MKNSMENWDERLRRIKREIGGVSPSFCLAKWLQVTLHLQNGHNHSCHHNDTHVADLEELSVNPSALHNTTHKKLQRQKMLEGVRPEECSYCWKVEDSEIETYSDRFIKSSDHWAEGYLQKIASQPWDQDISPTYIEVSFGNQCNFACAYCLPQISSKIFSELEKCGPYPVVGAVSIEMLKEKNKIPYKDESNNPYVHAFWEWFPGICSNLKVFRITGGEPLIHKNTYRVMDYLKDNPNPRLEFSVNSNFGVPDQYFEKYCANAQGILDSGAIQKLVTFTSVDTTGGHAEYVRDGLDYQLLLNRMYTYLTFDPRFDLTVMVTFNALSIPRFLDFLKDIYCLRARLKDEGRLIEERSRLVIDISILNAPAFMSPLVLPKTYLESLDQCLEYMERHSNEGDLAGFNQYETLKMRRLRDWFQTNSLDEHRLNQLKCDFVRFFHEYDRRRKKSFRETFPELAGFLKECEETLVRHIFECQAGGMPAQD